MSNRLLEIKDLYVKAEEKDSPVIELCGATTNLNNINESPEIVCCSILFTEDIVARVSSNAYVWIWFILAIAKANWNPMPIHTNIRLKVEMFGSLK